MTPLPPAARWLFHAQALLQLAVMGPILVVASFVGLLFVVEWTWAAGIALAFALLLSLWSLWMPSLTFERWGYQLDDEKLLIRSGVILRRLTAIPASRIQHVDTHQGPLERLMGLARLTVYTASGAGADGVIPGLLLDEATRLRDELVQVPEDDVV